MDLGGIGRVAIDTGVPLGTELLAVTDAVVLGDEDERIQAMGDLSAAAGAAAAVRAVAIVANFQLMNRLLDGVGVAPPAGTPELAEEIGVSWPG